MFEKSKENFHRIQNTGYRIQDTKYMAQIHGACTEFGYMYRVRVQGT